MEVDAVDLVGPDRYARNGAPHEAWKVLRREDPIHWCEPDGFESFWAITTHTDITTVSSQPDLFSSEEGIVLLSSQQLTVPQQQMRTLIEMDPPEHRSYRKVTSHCFTPKAIGSLHEIVTSSARNVIDALGAEGECDMVEQVAKRHPLRVLTTILGVDREDEERMLELTQQLLGSADPDLRRENDDQTAALGEIMAEFVTMFDRIIQDRRAQPRDDLATVLAAAHLEGCPMGVTETLGYYLILFTAGHETTRNALSGAIEAFARHPKELERLAQHPELMSSAVEEVLRWTSSVNYMKRTLLRDTVLRGRTLKEGDRLVLFYGSANRDERVFDDPFVFNIARHPNRHLGFGYAEHFCLGAHLARASITAVVKQLAARTNALELAGEPQNMASSFVIGRKTLPIRYSFALVA
jgi:cytochrome P450